MEINTKKPSGLFLISLFSFFPDPMHGLQHIPHKSRILTDGGCSFFLRLLLFLLLQTLSTHDKQFRL